MGESAIRVTDLAKRFRIHHQRDTSLKGAVLRGRRSVHEDFWAFQDVSFEVPKGSSLAILGSNGSGKSTLLKCLANILVPDRGSIVTEGNVAAMLELGAGFHPELSGLDNIFLQAAILGLDRGFVQQRLDEIIDFADIGEFIDQPVKNYSSGMYGRLGFAVAVHLDPDVLLIDEVLAVGDHRFQGQCFDRFAQLRQDGKSLVLVTHNVGAAQSMCDYGLWLDQGRTAMFGGIDEVSKAYLGDGAEPSSADDPETDKTPQHAGAKRLRVVRGIELLDENGDAVSRVLTGSRCSVRITLAPTVDIGPISMGLALIRSDQVMISRTAPQEPLRPSEDEIVIEVEFEDLFVLPGRYGWSVAIQTPDQSRTIEMAHLAKTFDVGGEVRSGVSGAVRLDGSWSTNKTAGVDLSMLADEHDGPALQRTTEPSVRATHD